MIHFTFLTRLTAQVSYISGADWSVGYVDNAGGGGGGGGQNHENG